MTVRRGHGGPDADGSARRGARAAGRATAGRPCADGAMLRCYLHDVGSVPLLTRSAEQDIARRIEREMRRVIVAVSRTPYAQLRVAQTHDGSPEGLSEAASASRRRAACRIAELVPDLAAARRALARPFRGVASERRARWRFARIQVRVSREFRRLDPAWIDALADAVVASNREIEGRERALSKLSPPSGRPGREILWLSEQIRNVERRMGADRQGLRSSARDIERARRA